MNSSTAVEILAHLRRRFTELGRPDARIVAVSKNHPPEEIAAFIRAGQLEFGESRFGEARDKIARISQNQAPADQRPIYHYISPLQSGNARQIPRIFSYVHGVSSLEALQVLLKAALRQREEEARQSEAKGEWPKGEWSKGWWPKREWPMRYFFQVRLTQESSKLGGMAVRELYNMEYMPQNDALHFAGLMAMGPQSHDPIETRAVFHQLRSIRDEIAPGQLLSMGMSADWEIALSEGADILRLGSLLFGSRKAARWSPEEYSANSNPGKGAGEKSA